MDTPDLEDKQSLYFLCFDIVEFYPSITEQLLIKALNFASNYQSISKEHTEIILHTKKSLLFREGTPWTKKSQETMFDVTMGSFDGAETCEVVGSYLLSILKKKFGDCIGLYRDDGLAAFKKTPQQLEKIKKQICKIFSDNGLRITVEANAKVINYLDVTLDLNTGQYQPYNKPGNTPSYIHHESNHPPNIIKSVPKSINKRLATISSSHETFSKSTRIYQEALQKSGLIHQLEYQQPTVNNKNNRKRKIIWFNPPYNRTVMTNIGGKFLKLITKNFPKNSTLHKIFNKNTVKVSYSCTKNMQQIINANNKKNLNTTDNNIRTRECNCRISNDCPLNGKCLTENIVYQATVATTDSTETYIGLTSTSFKTRYANHKASFQHQRLKNSTELSKYIWSLKERDIPYTTKWEIVKKSTPYTSTTKRCGLCIWEKFFIVYQQNMSTLNKRSELVTSCRHSAKFLLKNS